MQDNMIKELIVNTFLYNNKELNNLSLVSKQWKAVIENSEIWKKKINKQFHISIEELNKLKVADGNNSQKNFYKALYQKVYLFSNQLQKFHKIKYAEFAVLKSSALFLDYSTLEYLFSNWQMIAPNLFAACLLDDADYFFAHAEDITNHQDWCLINIFSGGNKITNRLIEGGANLLKAELKRVAILANNQNIALSFTAEVSADDLLCAVDSGNLSILQDTCNAFLNKSFDKLNSVLKKESQEETFSYADVIKAWQDAVGYAVLQGNLGMLKELFHHYQKIEVQGEQENDSIFSQVLKVTLTQDNEQRLVDFAAMGSTPEIINYLSSVLLLKPSTESNEMQFKFAVTMGNLNKVTQLLESSSQLEDDQDILIHAIRSGNLALVKYLLSFESLLNQENLENALEKAAQCGSFELVKYLLEPKFELQLDSQPELASRIVIAAASYGNLELVTYLINYTNLEFSEDFLKEIFCAAASSGNLKLICWLWEEKRAKHLSVDDFTEALATAKPFLIKEILSRFNKISEIKEPISLKSGDDSLYNSKSFHDCIAFRELFHQKLVKVETAKSLQFFQSMEEEIQDDLKLFLAVQQDIQQIAEIGSVSFANNNDQNLNIRFFSNSEAPVEKNNLTSEIFQEKSDTYKEYFCQYLEVLLCQREKFPQAKFENFLTLDFVKAIPLPNGQLLLAELAVEIGDKDLAVDLYNKSIKNFSQLGKIKKAEEVTAALNKLLNKSTEEVKEISTEFIKN